MAYLYLVAGTSELVKISDLNDPYSVVKELLMVGELCWQKILYRLVKHGPHKLIPHVCHTVSLSPAHDSLLLRFFLFVFCYCFTVSNKRNAYN